MDHLEEEEVEEEDHLQNHQVLDCSANPHQRRHLAPHHQLLFKMLHHQCNNNHKVEVCFQVLEQLWLKVWHSVQVLKSLTKLLDQFSEEVVAIKSSLLLLNKWLLNLHNNHIILVISNKINSCNVWKAVVMMSAFVNNTWMPLSNVRPNHKDRCNINDQFRITRQFITNDI